MRTLTICLKVTVHRAFLTMKTIEGMVPKAWVQDSEDEFGDDDEEDDADDDWKPPAAYMKKGQRGSVSAEAYGAFNQKQAFEPPVYEKSVEQETRINDVLSKSFLFNALSRSDSLRL